VTVNSRGGKAMTTSFQSVFRDGLFAGQAGIVTGAGSGIGRCTAHELAALGARVALVGRKKEKLDAVAQEIADAGGSAHVCPADIREEEQVREAVRAALGEFGRLDFLVNNAGGQFFSPLEAISAKGWDTVVRTNLNGGFLMARETYLQWMKANDEGERRRHRQYDRRHVERHAAARTFRRGARRHA
jgi:citronellol/citronellal dehydrogenase